MIQKTETNITSPIPNLMPKISPNDQIAGGINSVSSKQWEVFINVVHKWAKD